MRIYEAKCINKQVTIDQGDGVFVSVPDAFIMGDGTAESTGYCLVGENACLYITETQSDTQTVITSIANAIDNAVPVTAPIADTSSGGSAVNQIITALDWQNLSATLKGIELK